MAGVKTDGVRAVWPPGGWTGGRYSVFRLALGLCVAVHYALLATGDVGPLVRGGGLSLGLPDDPLLNPFGWGGAALARVLLGLAAAAGLPLALGLGDRLAAGLVFVVHTAALGRDAHVLGPGGWILGFLLLGHLVTPRAPFGSLARRGQADPGVGWGLPRPVYTALWILFAVVHLPRGVLLHAAAAGRPISAAEGTAVAVGLFARGTPPPEAAGSGTLVLSGVLALLAVVMAFSRRSRLVAWLLAVASALLLLPAGLVSGPLYLMLAAVFDHRWVPGLGGPKPIWVYYDGDCGLCHGTVRFLLSEDREALFRFAPLGGETFARRIPETTARALPDSLVVERGAEGLATKSEGVAYLLLRLGGLWRLLGHVLKALPRPLRDGAYDGVARVRRRLFTPPQSTCPVPGDALKDRFGP